MKLSPSQYSIVYSALIHAIRTNSGIGFHNNDQLRPTVAITDAPKASDLFNLLKELAAELGEAAIPPIRTWKDFCDLAEAGYRASKAEQ